MQGRAEMAAVLAAMNDENDRVNSANRPLSVRNTTGLTFPSLSLSLSLSLSQSIPLSYTKVHTF